MNSITNSDSTFFSNLKNIFKKYPDLPLFLFIAFCVSVFWMAGYGFEAFNALYSHDSLILDSTFDTNWEMGQGRFAQILYWQVRGTIAAPALVNFLAIFWLSICCFLIAKLFNLKNPLYIALIAGILSINPANTYANATYICWIDTYQLALTLAVGALYVLRKLSNAVLKILISTVLLIASLGLYQNYIAVFIFLSLVLFIKDIIEQRSLKSSLIALAFCIFSLFLGAIAYYGLWQVVLHFNPQVNVTSYNGFDTLGSYEGISLVSLLFDTYVYPFTYLARPETFHRKISGVLGILLLLIALALLIFRISKIRKPINAICAVIATLLLPLGINCVYFISKGVFHSLMVEPYYFSFVVLFALANSTLPTLKTSITKVTNLIISFGMIIIIFFNAVFANDAVLKKEFIYQSTDAAVTRIIDRIEETDGYEIGKTPVAFVGELRYSPLFTNRTSAFDKIEGVGFYNSSITRTSSTDQWLRNILGYYYVAAPSDVRETLSKSETVQQMGVFPAEDSIRMIDGVLTVKLSARM